MVSGAVRHRSSVRVAPLVDVLRPATLARPSPKLSTASKSPAPASSFSSGYPGASRVGPVYLRALAGSGSTGAVSSRPPWKAIRTNAVPVRGTGRSDGSAGIPSTDPGDGLGAVGPWDCEE